MRVNIFGKIYQINIEDLDDGNIGQCNHAEKKISIDANKLKCDPTTLFTQVLLHEIIHAIVDRCGFRQFIESQAEELLCENVARILDENFLFTLCPENLAGSDTGDLDHFESCNARKAHTLSTSHPA